MNYLLDTHTFLWFVKDDDALPPHIRSLIIQPTHEAKVSIVSFWEIAIKNSIGKLPLETTILGLESLANNSGIEITPLSVQSVHQVTFLPLHHKDPFDRIIAATALTSGDTLLSADSAFDAYGVHRLW